MPDRPTPPRDPVQLRAIIEALVFAAEEPLTSADLADLFPETPEDDLRAALDEVTRSCESDDRGLEIGRIAGGYRMATKPGLGEWVRALFRSRNRRRLSGAALETLAIVAYRQPITTPEIQVLRGIDPTAVLQSLMDKKLVRVLGRKKVVGKPLLYGTTRDFLAHFGLNALEDLPSLEEFGDLAVARAAAQVAGPAPEGKPGPFEEADQDDDSGDVEEFEDDGEDEREQGGDNA